MKKYIYFIIIKSIFLIETQAQVISKDTITWVTSRVEQVGKSEFFDIDTKFITYGSSHIIWTQKSGKLTYKFEISEIKENWNELDNNGTINYSVFKDGQKGEILIQRLKDEVYLIFDFSGSNDMLVKQKFLIKNYYSEK